MFKTQLKSGTTADLAAFAGIKGELTVSENRSNPYLHDGSRVGGFPIGGSLFSVVTPAIVSPSQGNNGVSVRPTVVTTPFAGDGTHAATYWEFSTNPTFTDLYHVSGRDVVNLTEYNLNTIPLNLPVDIEIYVRVRYESSNTAISNWSPNHSFTCEQGAVNYSYTVVQELTPVGALIGSNSAKAVAAYGDTIAAYGSDRLYIFERVGGVWEQTQAVFIGDENELYDNVVMWGNTIVVGHTGHSIDGVTAAMGRVVILTKQNNRWVIESTISAADGTDNDPLDMTSRFGTGLAILGDTLFVSAPYKNVTGSPSSGKVYVYQRINNEWIETDTLLPETATTDQLFGISLAVSGNTLVIGAAGYSVVYTHHAGKLSYQAKLEPASTQASIDVRGTGQCGHWVDIDKDTVIVSNNYRTVSAGAVHVFKRYGSDWVEVGLITAPTEEAQALFGSSLAIQGDVIVAHSPFDSTASDDGGNGYVYTLQDDYWGYRATLSNPTSRARERLGHSIAFGDDYIVLGTNPSISTASPGTLTIYS